MPNKITETTGTIESFNVSPKGSYEGMLVKNGGETMQVNFPPEWGARLAELAEPGSQVEIKAEAQAADPQEQHRVCRLISLRNAAGKSWPAEASEDDHDYAFAGTVARLNYALHGEVNGAILDTGDFLHTKPHGAHALKLAPGMKVKGSGVAKPAVAGGRVIDARDVNGVHLEPKLKKKKAHA